MTPADVRLPAYLPDTPEIRQDRANYYNAIERMDGQIGVRLKETRGRRARRRHDRLLLLRQRWRAAAQQALLLRRWPALRAGRGAPAEVGAPRAGEDGQRDHHARQLRGPRADPAVARRRCRPRSTCRGGRSSARVPGRPRTYAFGMRNRMDERYDFVRAATDGRFHYIRNYTPHRVFQHGAYEWQARGLPELGAGVPREQAERRPGALLQGAAALRGIVRPADRPRPGVRTSRACRRTPSASARCARCSTST